MALTTGFDPATMDTVIRYTQQVNVIEVEVLRQIAIQVAEKFVAEHYAEIAAKISQEAIATLSVAEAAAAIRETLAKKIPDRVLEIVREKPAQVYQRGILGGFTRIG